MKYGRVTRRRVDHRRRIGMGCRDSSGRKSSVRGVDVTRRRTGVRCASVTRSSAGV